MTNKEKYKQAFSAIHASDNFYLEAERMKKASKQFRLKTMVATAAACAMIAVSATAAYATDLGGIQRKIQLWIYGDQTEVTVQFDDEGSYNMEYFDSEGNLVEQGGGGVAFAPNGKEIPLSEKELMEHLTAPQVEYEEDGSVWIYWFDQKIDITNKFENDICYVKLVNGKEILYMTVNYQNGHSTSPKKYPSP